MGNLSFKPTNLPSVAKAMQQFPTALKRELGQSLRDGMEWVKAKAVQLAPKRDRVLTDSIYTRVVSSGEGYSGTIGATAKHAAIREYGGTIQAVNSPYLTFKTYDGDWVRVKQVTQEATPYMGPAVAQGRDDVVRELNHGMERSTTTIVEAA